MKKSFRIKIDDEEMTITVERQGDELVVERSGESYRVKVLPTEAQHASESAPRQDGVPNEPAAPRPAAAADKPAASATRPGAAGASPSPGGASGVPAPITGTVKEVLVNAGEKISAGERVMMMEAMKMDIEIVAPASGTVAQVFVAAGDSVRENQPLFRIE